VRIRTPASILMAAISAIAVCLLPAQPAAAANIVTTCAGVNLTTYNPPLQLIPRNVNFVNQGPLECTAVPGGAINGYAVMKGSGLAGCLTVGLPQATETIKWDGGGTTIIEYKVAVSARVNGNVIVTFTGQAVSGPYAGSVAERTYESPNIAVTACLERGISEVSGPSQLQLLL
jgi:hypothetical protein